MSDDYKKRVQAAVEKHAKSLLPKEPRGPRDNPEQRVVRELLKNLRLNGFSVDVVESSTFDKQAGYHTQNVTTLGFSDVVGCCQSGRALYLEMKAPGKRNTLRPSQRKFLTDKIAHNAFAIVCDSVESFYRQWSGYLDAVDRKQYLIDQLPPLTAEEKRRDDSGPLFED